MAERGPATNFPYGRITFIHVSQIATPWFGGDEEGPVIPGVPSGVWAILGGARVV